MAAPTFVNVGTPTGGAGTVLMPLPASIATDDILLLWVETENQAATISNQNGGTWAEIGVGSPQGTGTAGGPGGTRLTVFWSRYNGTQGNPTVGDSGDHQRGAILAFRGCVTTGDPWDVGAGNVASSASTSVTVPGATTTVADCMCVFGVANTTDSNTAQLSGGTWTNANLTGIANRVNANSTTGNGGGLSVGHGVKASAGAVGNTTGTLVTSSVQGRIMVALKPAANAYTLVAEAGSYAATGTVAGVLLGHLVAAAAGSYAVTGTAAGTLKGSAVIAAAGAYAQTGTDAVLTYTPANNHLLVADPGSYGITGTPASPLLGRVTSAGAGSYALTGTAASLLQTRLVSAGAGSYTHTGTAAGTYLGRNVAAGAGAYVLTGQDATLVYTPANNHIIVAGSGSYAVSGTNANALKTWVVTGAAGAYTLTGTSADFTHGVPAGAVAIHVATIALPSPNSGTVAITRRHGTSVMDNLTTADTTHDTSMTTLNTSSEPMGGV